MDRHTWRGCHGCRDGTSSSGGDSCPSRIWRPTRGIGHICIRRGTVALWCPDPWTETTKVEAAVFSNIHAGIRGGPPPDSETTGLWPSASDSSPRSTGPIDIFVLEILERVYPHYSTARLAGVRLDFARAGWLNTVFIQQLHSHCCDGFQNLLRFGSMTERPFEPFGPDRRSAGLAVSRRS